MHNFERDGETVPPLKINSDLLLEVLHELLGHVVVERLALLLDLDEGRLLGVLGRQRELEEDRDARLEGIVLVEILRLDRHRERVRALVQHWK